MASGRRGSADALAAHRARYLETSPSGAAFFPHKRELLEVYARYAAAMLDTATALSDARRRHEQSRAARPRPGRALRRVADALREAVREPDCVFRIGGEGVRASALRALGTQRPSGRRAPARSRRRLGLPPAAAGQRRPGVVAGRRRRARGAARACGRCAVLGQAHRQGPDDAGGGLGLATAGRGCRPPRAGHEASAYTRSDAARPRTRGRPGG